MILSLLHGLISLEQKLNSVNKLNTKEKEGLLNKYHKHQSKKTNMEPITIAAAYGGITAINKIVDYALPAKGSSQDKIQGRLEELRDLHQKERDQQNRQFQADIEANRMVFQAGLESQRESFQLEMEANRMAFQERQELRRLQFQDQWQRRQEEIAKLGFKTQKEIATFQACAMRETQILVARENAQNMLHDHMVQDALKSFPLNISPLVLLKNRHHSLSSLLRFTLGQNGTSASAMLCDVTNYITNPEALNIFIAPVYIDSKIKNRKVLSDQIWDTTYQQIESFFTTNYNRRSDRPVIMYSTAWNDKYSAGMHASETLHFFLKDMPCLVLEPRFDGHNFRLMISAWGLGYSSTEHIRAEMNFDLNIDALLATAAYQRSKKAIEVVDAILQSDLNDSDKAKYYMLFSSYQKNIKLYEALKIEDRLKADKMDYIEAFGLYNVLSIDPVQDLSLISDLLSSQITITLATLTDIHHLRSTATPPFLPAKMKELFPDLFENEELRKVLCKSYERTYRQLADENKQFFEKKEDKLLIDSICDEQTIAVQKKFGFENKTESWEDSIVKFCYDRYGIKDEDIEYVFDKCLERMSDSDIDFWQEIKQRIQDSNKQRRIDKTIQKFL